MAGIIGSLRSMANLLIYKALEPTRKSSNPKCIAKGNADNSMRDGAGCTVPPVRNDPYAAISRHAPDQTGPQGAGWGLPAAAHHHLAFAGRVSYAAAQEL
ncbi:protein of unknown function [Cupriavidus taiwanensis]|uniref:Uncharacterized protein n=1 Tax=Cupriavidus taiwanensis TaxID=164546 RepID=A0A7Z7JBL3_9BURK|nr:protein of unknown function [Cupriavidus taiwanensis]SOZ42753.1 protein of unknown function [Cupriavidus taiwanensis]SPC21957.1 protein of unknown function [Cupriavidus taiwanensis]